MVTNYNTYLNSDPIVKDFFLKHGSEGNEGFKPSHSHFKWVGLSDLGNLV